MNSTVENVRALVRALVSLHGFLRMTPDLAIWPTLPERSMSVICLLGLGASSVAPSSSAVGPSLKTSFVGFADTLYSLFAVPEGRPFCAVISSVPSICSTIREKVRGKSSWSIVRSTGTHDTPFRLLHILLLPHLTWMDRIYDAAAHRIGFGWIMMLEITILFCTSDNLVWPVRNLSRHLLSRVSLICVISQCVCNTYDQTDRIHNRRRPTPPTFATGRIDRPTYWLQSNP